MHWDTIGFAFPELIDWRSLLLVMAALWAVPVNVFILVGVGVINWVVSIDLYKFEIIQALFEVFMYIY